MASVRLLVTGDLHLGRRPTRLPATVDGERHSAARSWERVVGHALSRRVDAVILTGDVVDEYNKFYESVGPLERGVRELSDAGTPTFAVAGNHDHAVLPEVADTLDDTEFHLLGRDGQWERATVQGSGDAAIHLDGWSFPSSEYRDSPVTELDADPPDEPLLGVLHADLDAELSRYAPVQTGEMQALAHDGWLLGHTHEPDFREDEASPILYPGSPQPLDPGKTGPRGPWIVEVSPEGALTADHAPLATVRYENVGVELAEASSLGDVRSRVQEGVRRSVESGLESEHLEVLVTRLALRGRTPLHHELEEQADEIGKAASLGDPTVELAVDKVDVRTRPDLDLQALTEQSDPRGILASLLLDLRDGGDLQDEHERLLSDAVERMRRVRDSPTYSLLQSEEDNGRPDAPQASEVLETEAVRILDALQRQREGTA